MTNKMYKKVNNGPVRSNRLLRKKYRQYMLPALITYAALSVNEFVDSMLVSNMLGSEAMAVVSLGMPVMLVMSAAYAMLGNGGATIYALSLGRRDTAAAGRSFTAACVAALTAGLLIMLPGLLLRPQLAGLLCSDQTLLEPFKGYLRVLLLSAPFEVLVLTVALFLPAAGHPGMSTAVNVIANVINIAMDVVYIRFMHMGVEGAAWATLTGYVCGALFLAVMLALKRARICFSTDIPASLSDLKTILERGRPDAMNQIGLSIQFAVCNRLVLAYAGANGAVAFSLCLQANSVISIFIGAILGASTTIMAVLHGQHDYRGETGILNTSLKIQIAFSLTGTILLTVFAVQAAHLYNIHEPGQLALAVFALRAYSSMFVPRYFVVVYYYYLKVIGFVRYSTALSSLDSFALVVPVVWILTMIFGIKGFFFAFVVTDSILVAAIFIVNRRIAAKSGGRYKGVLLYECDDDAESIPVLDVTISNDSSDIAYISTKLQEICEERGLSRTEAIKAALAAEEIAVYVANRKRQSTYADVLARVRGGNVEIDFRSLGEIIDPMADDDDDIQENVKILRSVASSISNEYVLGMNSIRAVIEGCRA